MDIKKIKQRKSLIESLWRLEALGEELKHTRIELLSQAQRYCDLAGIERVTTVEEAIELSKGIS